MGFAFFTQTSFDVSYDIFLPIRSLWTDSLRAYQMPPDVNCGPIPMARAFLFFVLTVIRCWWLFVACA